MTRIAVLGSTSGIAEACLRQWAEQQADLILVARDADRLATSAADLTVRGASSVATIATDLGTPEGVQSAVAEAFAAGPLDVVLIAFGVMPPQSESDESLSSAHAVLNITGSLNVEALHWTALRLIEQGNGTVAVLGSVAGDRGRRSHYLYGSAKAMVATAAAGLQHRTRGTGVNVLVIKPGPTRTAMTADLPRAESMASPDAVGRDILRAIDKRKRVLYTPGRWRIIMAIVRWLPRPIFERTGL